MNSTNHLKDNHSHLSLPDIGSVALHNLRLNEEDYVHTRSTGFFHGYFEKKTKKTYSAFLTSLSPVTDQTRDVFERKLEAYIKLQDRVEDLLKVYGYFILEKGSPVKNIVLLVEPGYETLSDLMLQSPLEKNVYLDLETTISQALNYLYEKNYKLSYIAPQDIVGKNINGKIHFKLFGIQNGDSIGKASTNAIEWASPELLNKLKFSKDGQIDFSKSLNFSFGLVLLYAGTKLRPMIHRTLNEEDQEEKNELAIIADFIEKVEEHFDFKPESQGMSQGQDATEKLFLKRLAGSLILDKNHRTGIEVWLSDKPRPPQARQDVPKSTHRTSILFTEDRPILDRPAVIEVLPALKVEAPQQARLNVSSEPIHIGEINQGNPSNREGEGVEGVRRLYSENQNSRTIQKAKSSQNQRPRKTISSVMRSFLSKIDFDPEEMAPFSIVVGIFCGMIFIAVLTVILLVSG